MVPFLIVAIKLVDFAKQWRCHVVTLLDTLILLEPSPFRSLRPMALAEVKSFFRCQCSVLWFYLRFTTVIQHSSSYQNMIRFDYNV